MLQFIMDILRIKTTLVWLTDIFFLKYEIENFIVFVVEF